MGLVIGSCTESTFAPGLSLMHPIFRTARRDELPDLVRLLDDDDVGRGREILTDPLPDAYYAAFDRIAANPDLMIAVAEYDRRAVGILQLAFIQHLSRVGAVHAVIENVRVDRTLRGSGIGGAFIKWAVEECRERGCVMIELTSNGRRTDAHRFYERLGFQKSHAGFKMML